MSVDAQSGKPIRGAQRYDKFRDHGLGLDAHTEVELEDALGKVAKEDGLALIEIHAVRMDCPEALLSGGRSMAKTNQLD